MNKTVINFKKLGQLGFFIFLLAHRAESQCTITCIASTDGNFNTASTWGGTKPTTCDCFEIPISRTVTNSADLTLTQKVKITIQFGGTLTFSNNKSLVLSNDLSTIVKLSGGTISAPGGGGNIRLSIGTSPLKQYSGADLLALPSGNITLTNVGALPVELAHFSADKKAGNAELHWQTASENNSERFEIERSVDGLTYETIGAVAAAGLSNDLLDYVFEDREPAKGRNYYRLRIIDRDEKADFSPIAAVDFTSQKTLFAQIENGSNEMAVRFESPQNGKANLNLFDFSGRLLINQSIEVERGEMETMMDLADLPNGFFVLQMNLPGQRSESLKISKF